MKIRNASSADIPSLLHLEHQSVTAGHWTEQQYRDAIGPAGAERLVLIAEEPDQARREKNLLGFLVAQHIAPEWELENIVVAATARRMGLGRRLLDALLDRARETNSQAVFLEVRESNTPARSLYEKAGFHTTGRRRSYYTNPAEDAVLYRLTMATGPFSL